MRTQWTSNTLSNMNQDLYNKSPTYPHVENQSDFGAKSIDDNQEESQNDGTRVLLESSFGDLIGTQTTTISESGVEPWGKNLCLPIEQPKKRSATQNNFMRKRTNTPRAIHTATNIKFWQVSSENKSLDKENPAYFENSPIITNPENTQDSARMARRNLNDCIGIGIGPKFQDVIKPHKNNIIANSEPWQSWSVGKSFVKGATKAGSIKNMPESIFRIKVKPQKEGQTDQLRDSYLSNQFEVLGRSSELARTFDDRLFKSIINQEARPGDRMYKFLQLQGPRIPNKDIANPIMQRRGHQVGTAISLNNTASIVKPSAQGVLSLEIFNPKSKNASKSPFKIKPRGESSLDMSRTQEGYLKEYSQVRAKLMKFATGIPKLVASKSMAPPKEDIFEYGSKLGIHPDKKLRNLGVSKIQPRPKSKNLILTHHLQNLLSKLPKGNPCISYGGDHLTLRNQVKFSKQTI
jgi:hypothetical protein